MIEKKIWDSDFFGIEIGLLDNVNYSIINQEINNSINQFDLIYIFSDSALDQEYSSLLVDTKVMFSMDLKSGNENSAIKSINNITQEEYDSLLELAYLSGHLSRFKTDEKFPVNSFKRLYKEWLDKSLNKTLAFDVLGYYIDDKIIGFITLEDKGNKTSQIGLVAVSPIHQGKGIAKALIQAAINSSLVHDFEKITVPTQLENTNAMVLYSKVGFTEISKTFIYHYWKI